MQNSQQDLLRAVNRLSRSRDFEALLAWWNLEKAECEQALKVFDGISLTRMQGECRRIDALIELVEKSKNYDGGM